jgi:8-oxo-dGTP diphosphatase
MLQVAVGVITNQNSEILLTLRPKHVHQGGLWEFPGGKLEAGESVQQALYRELQEEIGIQVETAQPLIRVRHDYGDKRVELDVWRVTQYTGTATACEGQQMRWVGPEQLPMFSFPAANMPIIKAAQLPECYAILEGRSVEEVLKNCTSILKRGIKLIQLRLKTLAVTDRTSVLPLLVAQCQQQQVKLLLNSDLGLSPVGITGIHLSSRSLLASQTRPIATWVAASCHNLQELKHAEQIGVDFVVLAAVKATTTHPGQTPLGWETVSAWIDQVNLPVYVMGGLSQTDLPTAFLAGAQGIAGISAFLD